VVLLAVDDQERPAPGFFGSTLASVHGIEVRVAPSASGRLPAGHVELVVEPLRLVI
jgi:hypothetical protein